MFLQENVIISQPAWELLDEVYIKLKLADFKEVIRIYVGGFGTALAITIYHGNQPEAYFALIFYENDYIVRTLPMINSWMHSVKNDITRKNKFNKVRILLKNGNIVCEK